MKHAVLIFFLVAGSLISCSKKVHPVATESETVKKDSIAEKKVVVKKKAREPLPKVISVNDLSAKKTIDGRYYYDLQGHRYWRNNKDGKYYLFNKAMYADDAYKPN
ncbi:hypothetical protein [Ferruginibacter sp.]|uniref:hypothetical protein n=1 Tax=Ferruginibacter sp. TaxID=1940288 RepID=UPI002658C955|nr:hypothetical protein [Ferruginibacter sp.]